jgi:hypothetical protein
MTFSRRRWQFSQPSGNNSLVQNRVGAIYSGSVKMQKGVVFNANNEPFLIPLQIKA